MTNALDLSTTHLGALAAIAVATAALCVAARRRPGAWMHAAAVGLAAVTIVAELAWIVWLVGQRQWTPAIGLPLQLCDAATALAAVALVTRRQVAVELLWFWACAGSVQALLTPDVPQPFPTPMWLQYYLTHGDLIAAALFLVVGLGLRPRPLAALRAAALTVAYAAAVAVADVMTGGDYLFLRARPLTPSLLDAMGPWPWYLVAAAALALVLFAVLEAPFRLGGLRRIRGRRTPPRGVEA